MALALKLFRNSKLIKYQYLNKMERPISTTSARLNEAVENLKTNPYFDKYSKKIAALQQTSPEEFLSRIDTHVKSRNPKPKTEKEQKPMTSGQAKPLIDNKPQIIRTKQLNDYMKLELLSGKSADEIKEIWLDYHRNKDVIAAVVPKETYELMHGRGKEFNTFLLPLPRNQGYEFIVCQFYNHEIHFTPLIAYQTHKENAPECLTMVHYTEFVEDKGIVLMKGEYNTDVLQAHEAHCLINELQLYYAHNNEKRLNMLRRFTYAPDEFKHMDLIADMECLSL